jgi:hypothetical protein
MNHHHHGKFRNNHTMCCGSGISFSTCPPKKKDCCSNGDGIAFECYLKALKKNDEAAFTVELTTGNALDFSGFTGYNCYSLTGIGEDEISIVTVPLRDIVSITSADEDVVDDVEDCY